MKRLAGLRHRVRQEQETLAQGQQSENRTKGPAHFLPLDEGLWTKELVLEFCPPGTTVNRDMVAMRWQLKWPFGSVSRAFNIWGYKEAAIIALKVAWASFKEHAELRCDVPGLADPAPAGDEEVVGPPEAVEPAARGRGRGRGGRAAPARGRKGRGRGAEPAAPSTSTAFDEAPESVHTGVVADAAHSTPSSDSDSDSSSSSSSSIGS